MLVNNILSCLKAVPVHYLILLLFICASLSFAQTTGKISGKITDAKEGEPLPGVNVVIEGTNYGAASDANGNYFIINIPPGTYRLRASIIGYESVVMQNLIVSVNRTTTADFKMNETVIQGEEVVVTVPRIQTKKDQTSSIRNITSDEISQLPVESLEAVVSVQAGVVKGHFRGGRIDEVAYMVDGVKVDEAYGNSRSVTVENDIISEVEVITGTFNAEYGNAMSGIVNAVTKEGAEKFSVSVNVSSANYLTGKTNDFSGINETNFFRNKDVSLFLEGPVVNNSLSFVFNGRYQDNTGARSGIRYFMPDNFSNFSSDNSANWYSEHTGDNEIIPMETNKTGTLFGKLSFRPFESIRTSLSYSFNREESQSYNHFYKYNPDGRPVNHRQSHFLNLIINQAITPALFYEFKSSYLYSWNGIYVYENPLDSRYVHDQYASGSIQPLFSVGGQDKNWSDNNSTNYNQKIDLTWQVNQNHVIKTGAELTNFAIHQFNTQVLNLYRNTGFENESYYDTAAGKTIFYNYQPDTSLEKSVYTDIYDVNPWQLSFYLQDKMEFDEMVINLGLRFDYFDPNAVYPSQPRNPGNQLENVPRSEYLKAPSSYKLSPRFGISYKLGEQALLRFSYGHFFQTPPLYALYTNYNHVIGTGDFQTLMGNPLVKAQKTVQYEAGLWQQLSLNMSLEVAVFYRDIYDLLGTTTYETYNAIKYGLYSNKDYGNVRGVELKYDYISGNFSARLNYTLQYTRGNADDPTFAFSREGAKLDPVNVLIPMSWDQRHTLNTSLAYYTEAYGASILARLDSGTPYTWSPLNESRLALVHLNPNNSNMPLQFSVDLQAFVNLFSFGSGRARLNLIVYNLLDRLNETSVNNTTGRANQVIIRESDLLGYKSNFSTVYDVYNNPANYADPRLVKLGIEVLF
jgi:outer membrane receptor protein involved in Fe transport